MSDYLLERQIDHQIAATEQPIKSLADGSGPLWFEASTGRINEPLLVSLLVDKYKLTRCGKQVKGESGQLVTPDTLKRMIAQEIGPFVPEGTARRLDPIKKLLMAYLPEMKQELTFSSFSAKDLDGEEIEATPFIVDQLLPCGLTIMAAPPKTGKSWLCLALADAVASGATFWGHKVTSGEVQYLALEDSKSRLQSRLKAIGSSMPRNLHFVLRGAMTLETGLLDQITNWIDEHPETRLIILDTLQRIKGAAQYGIDAYAGDYARLAPLQELAVEKKVAILAVHHFKKQGNFALDDAFERMSGSTALFGASDCAWAIFGKRGSEEMTLHVTGRDVFDNEYKIKFDASTKRWQLLGNSEQLEEQRKSDEYNASPLVNTIRELVKESGGRWIGSARDIISEVMKRKQVVPASSERALKHILQEQQERLLTIDQIAFTQAQGGRYGRDYTFETTKQMKF